MKYSKRVAARRTNAFSGLYSLPLTAWCPGLSICTAVTKWIPAVLPFAGFYLPVMCWQTHKACEPIMEIEVKKAKNSVADAALSAWNATGWTAV